MHAVYTKMDGRGRTGFSDAEYETHVVHLGKSRLKSSIRTSALLAGFSLVRAQSM